jgi:MOSC domain-containing protein YiiM
LEERVRELEETKMRDNLVKARCGVFQTAQEVVSVHIGRAKVYGDFSGAKAKPASWKSGFVKSMVQGPVFLGANGVQGDEQADLVHHGGVDKAVLGYAQGNYSLWDQEIGYRFPNGGFGENLTFAGLSELSVCIGDRYQIGEVVLEVSQARIPCWKINRRWNRDDLLQRVRETGWTGWYFRVLQPGTVSAGDAVHLLARQAPEWTIARVNDAIHKRLNNREALAGLVQLPGLAASQRDVIQRRLQHADDLFAD